jgi:hypothetical protein
LLEPLEDNKSEREVLYERIYQTSRRNELFEKIYFECRLKPLIEQVFREAHLREMADTVPDKFARTLRNAYSNLRNTVFTMIDIVKKAITYLKGEKIIANNPKARLHLLSSDGKEIIIKGDNYNESFKNARSYAGTILASYENQKLERFYTNKQRNELKETIASEICREYEVFTPNDKEYTKQPPPKGGGFLNS